MEIHIAHVVFLLELLPGMRYPSIYLLYQYCKRSIKNKSSQTSFIVVVANETCSNEENQTQMHDRVYGQAMIQRSIVPALSHVLPNTITLYMIKHC